MCPKLKPFFSNSIYFSYNLLNESPIFNISSQTPWSTARQNPVSQFYFQNVFRLKQRKVSVGTDIQMLTNTLPTSSTNSEVWRAKCASLLHTQAVSVALCGAARELRLLRVLPARGSWDSATHLWRAFMFSAAAPPPHNKEGPF